MYYPDSESDQTPVDVVEKSVDIVVIVSLLHLLVALLVRLYSMNDAESYQKALFLHASFFLLLDAVSCLALYCVASNSEQTTSELFLSLSKSGSAVVINSLSAIYAASHLLS